MLFRLADMIHLEIDEKLSLVKVKLDTSIWQKSGCDTSNLKNIFSLKYCISFARLYQVCDFYLVRVYQCTNARTSVITTKQSLTFTAKTTKQLFL